VALRAISPKSPNFYTYSTTVIFLRNTKHNVLKDKTTMIDALIVGKIDQTPGFKMGRSTGCYDNPKPFNDKPMF
jgi:hypothetical protein